ncbi:hypothetical protein KMP13_04470 [Epibacterium ulvae]|uniref:hypothetical protein n=1 Tax=Epibacterium ulvae TaxID=1156985 RepID=UPI001BFC99BB|nr:hypothetical protein [Epibacterium ulvae]MBT8153155.1 hypothetical protein [Epibacterium ulvae]
MVLMIITEAVGFVFSGVAAVESAGKARIDPDIVNIVTTLDAGIFFVLMPVILVGTSCVDGSCIARHF